MEFEKQHRLVVVRGGGWRIGDMDEGNQNVQTSSYKIIRSLRCNVQHGGVYTVLHIEKLLRADLKSPHHKKRKNCDYAW